MNRNKNEITITDEESRTCLLDNKKFESSRKMIWYVRKTYQLSFEDYILKVYYNDIRPICLKTGQKLSFKANKCGPWFSNYSKNNFPRKNHTSETKEKIKKSCEQTFLKKYGKSNVFQTEECKKKIKKTMLKKYGVDNIMKSTHMKTLFSSFEKSNDVIISTKITNNKKYGVDHFFKTKQYKLKLRKDLFKRHYSNWTHYINHLSEFLSVLCISKECEFITDNPTKFVCKNCNTTWEEETLLIPICNTCNEDNNFRSNLELSFFNWINTLNVKNINPNKRFTVDNTTYEVDFLIGNLVIELNGLYWHSEIGGNKDKKYHINKLIFLNKLGYDVINIFEDEWLFKTDIVKSKILSKLNMLGGNKIYARKCHIQIITNRECSKFLEKNHIQGNINASICLGAYFNDNLIAVMSFSNPKSRKTIKTKTTDESVYELVRFATDINCHILGIGGKLLTYFIKHFNPTRINTYADRRWTTNSNDNLYTKLNFELLSTSEPSYWYTKKYAREYRYKYRKQVLITEGFDPNKTEWEIMKDRGYDRIWDCGNFKYQLEI